MICAVEATLTFKEKADLIVAQGGTFNIWEVVKPHQEQMESYNVLQFTGVGYPQWGHHFVWTGFSSYFSVRLPGSNWTSWEGATVKSCPDKAVTSLT